MADYDGQGQDLRRLIDTFERLIAGKDVLLVVGAAEALIGNAVMHVSVTREDAHAGVDAVAADIKAYCDARLAERLQRGDVAGHA